MRCRKGHMQALRKLIEKIAEIQLTQLRKLIEHSRRSHHNDQCGGL